MVTLVKKCAERQRFWALRRPPTVQLYNQERRSVLYIK
uniref:Uncharacterized protein n=1 Tax=Agrobacterium tumefaciens TaxID=358 RepID=A0A3S6ID65_AGRTU|nr:hypothetical protein AgrTiEU6_56 [Agrobacterium tumefaciens]